MRRCHNKGAIELSANFIVIIVISILILIAGLSLFFKLKDNLGDTVSTYEDQMEQQMRNIMLSTGGRVAVYPSDPKNIGGDSKMVAIGVNNMLDVDTFTVEVVGIDYYSTSESQAEPKEPTVGIYYDIQSTELKVQPGSQGVKGILLKIPRGESGVGEYVYTIKVTYSGQYYDTVQVYVRVP